MADLTKLQRSLGVKFRDQGLLRKALTHGSYIHENPDAAQESNQRLEFLGDAVLGHVVAQELYLRFPSLNEGQLTEARAQMVRTESLSAAAHRLGIGDCLYFGKGEEGSGGEFQAEKSGWRPGGTHRRDPPGPGFGGGPKVHS